MMVIWNDGITQHQLIVSILLSGLRGEGMRRGLNSAGDGFLLIK